MGKQDYKCDFQVIFERPIQLHLKQNLWKAQNWYCLVFRRHHVDWNCPDGLSCRPMSWRIGVRQVTKKDTFLFIQMVKSQHLNVFFDVFKTLSRDVATVATCVAEALRQDCLEQVCLSFVCFPADFCFWSHYCLPFFFASVFWYNNKKGNQAHEP